MLSGRLKIISNLSKIVTRSTSNPLNAVLMSSGGESRPGSASYFSPQQVQHIRSEKKFILKIDESSGPAIIEYELVEPGVLDLYHTEVPEVHRDKGVARVLAVGAFDHIKREKLRMKLSCWYLQGYLERNPNPDYAALVVKN